MNAVNLVNVRLYGETEFWFALIKVLVIYRYDWLWPAGCCFLVTAARKPVSTTSGATGGFATGWNGSILSLAGQCSPSAVWS
ncbi:hypothetical protein ACULNC_25805 [Shigella flexneri]